ncbi:MAG: antitoxin [Verrucomicrobia bacterium]|nr:antitoxin [Verrucomicrobiota bacterium]
MAVLQVRNMADDIYGALGRRAALDNRSISQEVIEIIERYLATPRNLAAADVEALGLAGSWNDSRPAGEIVGAIRKERSTRRFREGF